MKSESKCPWKLRTYDPFKVVAAMPLTTTHSALKILNREVDLFGYIYVHIYIVPPFLPKMFFTPSEYFLRPRDKKAFRYIGIGSW